MTKARPYPPFRFVPLRAYDANAGAEPGRVVALLFAKAVYGVPNCGDQASADQQHDEHYHHDRGHARG